MGTPVSLSRRIAALVALIIVLACALMAAGATGATATASAEVVWLCKPGETPNPCRESNETTVFEANGSSRVENLKDGRSARLSRLVRACS